MNKEEKDLLRRDLSARLPYGVKVYIAGDWFEDEREPYDMEADYTTWRSLSVCNVSERVIKPYLRPMSSMTDEEKKEFTSLGGTTITIEYCGNMKSVSGELYDWLNAHHFDYRGLIKRGLAIEVTEDINPYK